MGMIGAAGSARVGGDESAFPEPKVDLVLPADAGPQTVVLAGGCFWCVEGVFERLPGVTDVVSGYAGDSQETANYKAVSTGKTRHAEVVKVTYDPAVTSLGRILKVFFYIAHDPTQLNRQGPDVGPHYRSAIFYASEDQQNVAQAYIRQLDEARYYKNPIATTLEPLEAFYPAELYHQDFVKQNPDHPYIQFQAMPKVKKVESYVEGSK